MKNAVFVLPHLGSEISTYKQFKKYSNENIQFIPIEYKGRGKRRKEGYYKNLKDAIDDMVNTISVYIETGEYQSISIFGHSMGAAITYEIAKQIENKYMINMIFLSGFAVPENRFIETNNDEEFVKWMKGLGGIDNAIWENKSLLEYYLEIAKHDREIFAEECRKWKKQKIRSRIILMYAIDDPICKGKMDRWKSYTDSDVKEFKYVGGHFYLFKNTEKVIKQIEKELKLVG